MRPTTSTTGRAFLSPEQPTVLKLGASNADSFWIGSAGDPACGLLDMVVTCNWPGETPESWSYEATTEAVLALDPDVIVLGNWSEMDDAGLQAALEANPLWGEIRAVKEGRVVTVPGAVTPDPHRAKPESRGEIGA